MAAEIDFLVGTGGVHGPKDKSGQVKLIMHNNFVDKCGEPLQQPTSKESNIIMLNSSEEGGEDQLQSMFHIFSDKFSLKSL
jgi:hypothetical protein